MWSKFRSLPTYIFGLANIISSEIGRKTYVELTATKTGRLTAHVYNVPCPVGDGSGENRTVRLCVTNEGTRSAHFDRS